MNGLFRKICCVLTVMLLCLSGTGIVPAAEVNEENPFIRMKESENSGSEDFVRNPKPQQPEYLTGVQDNADGSYSVKNLNIPADAGLFNGHYYYYFDIPDLSWNISEMICSVYSGNLVSINTAEEQEFLEKQYPGTTGWIGAKLNDEGTWEWVSGDAFEYTNWKDGEPNDQNGEEGYAHLYTGMKWNDLPDNDTTYHTGFYCEWSRDYQRYYYDGPSGGMLSDETKQYTEEGKGYYYGTGPEGFDPGKAREKFRAAVDEDDGEAWYYIGLLYDKGLVDIKHADYRAMGAYSVAAEKGSSLGWLGQGMAYLEGTGTAKNYDTAMKLFQRALDLGCTEANQAIGYMYARGLGVNKDDAAALEYYEKAMQCEDFGWRNLSTASIGDLYFDGFNGAAPDYEKAFEWYSKGAQEGYGESCKMIGYMYENGLGVEQNMDSAIYWYDWAAWYGDQYSMRRMGDINYFGEGVDVDYSLALDFYLKAAELGNVSAMYFAGFMYENGQGTSRDFDAAREWYRKILDSPDADIELKETVGEEMAWMDSEENSQAFEAQNNTQTQQSGYNEGSQYETQPWEDPYFIGYTQDGTPQYSYDYYEYDTQPWEDPNFIGYTQDGTPQYSYDYYEYETQPWEDPYFIGYTQDGTPQYSNR